MNQKFEIHGWAHITGGGIVGKLEKILAEGLQAVLEWGSWPVQDIFNRIQDAGDVPVEDMRRTFNLGLGMVGIASKEEIKEIIEFLNGLGERTFLIGEVFKSVEGERVVLV